jgi:hypothetical protein
MGRIVNRYPGNDHYMGNGTSYLVEEQLLDLLQDVELLILGLAQMSLVNEFRKLQQQHDWFFLKREKYAGAATSTMAVFLNRSMRVVAL